MIRLSTFFCNNVTSIIYLVFNELNNFFFLYCIKLYSHALQQKKILKQTLDGTISSFDINEKLDINDYFNYFNIINNLIIRDF